MKKYQPILDPCCDSRMWHHKKNNPLVLFNDIRRVPRTTLTNRTTIEITPDTQHDFRNLPFKDNSFILIVFDPPHAMCGTTSFLYTKYGTLFPSWQADITAGFEQLFRVLKPNGTLVFKWCDTSLKIDQILACTPMQPIITHKVKSMSGKKNTYFIVFFKPRKGKNAVKR